MPPIIEEIRNDSLDVRGDILEDKLCELINNKIKGQVQKVAALLYVYNGMERDNLVRLYLKISNTETIANARGALYGAVLQPYSEGYRSTTDHKENILFKTIYDGTRIKEHILTERGKQFCINDFPDDFLKRKASDEIEQNNETEKETSSIINRIFYGPPGTGKTYKINEIKEGVKPENFVFVTFHQSYSYEDFIEGIRPIMQNKQAEQGNSGDVSYEIRPGIFKKLCDKARKSQDPNERFVIFIDEINRGNISKIFGELITLIEHTYRAPVDYEWNKWRYRDKKQGQEPSKKPKPIEVKLPYSGKLFSVPENVKIYGAMNTADRSLTLIDTALRRRFEFVPMWPKSELLPANLQIAKDKSEVTSINVQTMLTKMNERIEAIYDRDHTLGHAFFWSLNKNNNNAAENLRKLSNIFRNKIIPTLEEYFFEDWEKIRLVLLDQFVTEKSNEGIFPDLQEDRYSHLLHTRYEINEEAFTDPEAYRALCKERE